MLGKEIGKKREVTLILLYLLIRKVLNANREQIDDIRNEKRQDSNSWRLNRMPSIYHLRHHCCPLFINIEKLYWCSTGTKFCKNFSSMWKHDSHGKILMTDIQEMIKRGCFLFLHFDLIFFLPRLLSRELRKKKIFFSPEMSFKLFLPLLFRRRAVHRLNNWSTRPKINENRTNR